MNTWVALGLISVIAIGMLITGCNIERKVCKKYETVTTSQLVMIGDLFYSLPAVRNECVEWEEVK